jgi:hypothetical protein
MIFGHPPAADKPGGSIIARFGTNTHHFILTGFL